MNLLEKLKYIGDEPIGRYEDMELYRKIVSLIGKPLADEIKFNYTGNQIIQLINERLPLEEAVVLMGQQIPVSQKTLTRFYIVIGMATLVTLIASYYFHAIVISHNPDMANYLEYVTKMFDFILAILPIAM